MKWHRESAATEGDSAPRRRRANREWLGRLRIPLAATLLAATPAVVVLLLSGGSPEHRDPLSGPAACGSDDRECASAKASDPAEGRGSAVVPPGSVRGAPSWVATRSASPRATTSPRGAQSSPPVPVPPAPPAPGAQGRHSSPYLDMTLGGGGDAVRNLHAAGVRDTTLAFVVDGGGCTPVWGGATRLDDPATMSRVKDIQAAGGRVRIAFGGAAGTDVAEACESPARLADAYAQVLDAYGADRIELDVDGRSLAQPEVVARRNEALRLLQTQRQVQVSYALPALPGGLTPEGVALLRDAAARQVAVASVNLLAMNFGPGAAPQPAGRMGEHAVSAAQAAHATLRAVWPQLTEAQAWERVTVTVMIGDNDVPGEKFTVDDARRLTEFATQQKLGGLSWWSASRDKPCGPDVVAADPGCSGVPQEAGAYAKILGAY